MAWLGIILKQLVSKFSNSLAHPLLLETIYRPPSAFVDSFSNIEQLVKLIDDENKEFYLLGDVNANMLDNWKIKQDAYSGVNSACRENRQELDIRLSIYSGRGKHA